MVVVLILLIKSLLGSCGNETCGTTQSACGEKSGCVWNDASVGECRKKEDLECVTLAEEGCTSTGSGCEWVNTGSCVRTTDPNCGVLVDGACAAGCTEDGTTLVCVANDKKCKELGDAYGQAYCSSALTIDGLCGAFSSGDCQFPCKLESGTCKFDEAGMSTWCGSLVVGTASCVTSSGGWCKLISDGVCVFDSNFISSYVPSCKWESNTCKFDSSKGGCSTSPSAGGGCTEGSSEQCDLESKPICNAITCQSNANTCTSASVQAGCEWKPSYCKPDSYSCGSSSGPCSSTAKAEGCVSTEASAASCSLIPNLDCASKTTQPVCEATGCKWTPEDKSLVIYAPLLLITLSLLICL